MANPLLKYAKGKKTSQPDYQQTNQGAQNPERTDGSQTGTGNTNPLLKYANSVSSSPSSPAAPAASSTGAVDVSSPSTSPSSDSLSALKKQRADIYNSIDRRRAEMDRQYANDVYKQLTEIDGKIDRIENPGREDAGEAYRKAKRTYEAELAYGDADTRAAAKKELEEKKADFSAAGGNPDATIVGSALKEYAGSLATGFGVLSATSGLVGMNPEELPADYEMQRALLDQARKNSSGQNEEINSIVERGQKLVEEGAMGVESAKAGRSAAGKFLVDLAVQATMMGGDMLLGLATGGGMAPLIARAYGGSVNEAIADGADYNMASLYGAAAAATEAFTERMFDGFAQVYGQGDSTKLVSYVSGKLAKTDAGRLAWQYIINGMGEGVEEVVSDLVNPLIKTIYNGKKLSQNYKDLNIGDIAYDFIVGAALGYSGVAVEAIGGTGMSDTAKFFSDAAGNGMSFKEACKLYEAMWTAYDEWVSRETDGKNAGYTDTQNAAGVNSGLFAEEDIVEGTGEYVDAAENATNNAPTATEADASGMTAEEYASVLEQSMQPVQQEADIQTEQQSTPAVQQVEQENDISSAFDPFYNGDVINAGAVEEAVQNGTFPVEAIESIPVDEDIRNDKTTTNELIERGEREYAEKTAAQTQQETPQSTQSASNTSTAPTQETSVTQQQTAPAQTVSAEKKRAIAAAESYGESGVPFSLLVGDDMGTKLDSVRELTPKEREEAYLRGKKRAESKAQNKQGQRDAEANGNTGWRRGKVIGDGVKISDMKETFNDPQGLSYTILSTISEVTGIDIILYRSEAENGVFTMYEGKFKKSTDQIYLDLNSGLMRSMDADQLSKYVMLRTFGHELTHFDEKWSPVLYNEFRQAVFDHMEKNGTDVDALIREQQDNGMSYEAASREVVADAMTDVLPDSNFVEMLAKEHRNLFQRILDKLKEFVAKVKEAFAKMVPNNKAAANAMKENLDGTLRYAQNIVDLFDRMTVDAVERYQRAKAVKETTTEETTSGTKETRTPVSLNALIAKAETYADDQTGKQQLTKLMEDAYTRGQNRTPVTVDDLLAEVRDIVDTDTGKEQLAGLVAAAYLRGQSNAQNAAKRKETVETAPESKPTVEEAKANLKKSIKVPVETTNAKALEHGIKTETLSIDSVTFGTPPAGFNSMQQQAIASGLIEGVYKDEQLIKLDVPYDGQFTIENTVQNVVRILEKLHVKATQEATITKELARLLKKGGAVARSGDVYFAGTNKVMLRVDKDTYDFAMSPKYEGGYDAMPHTFGESFVDNLKKDGPAPVPVVADISAGAGFGGEYYVFDVSGEKVYFRKSDISLIDGNGRTLYIEKVKSNGFYASTFDENGVCGIIINVRLESPTTVYTKPSNLKCFKTPNTTTRSPISAEVRALKNSDQPEHRAAYRILTEYLREGKQLTSKDLYAIADTEFGGTQAQGGYDRKDAYDAMELAVNRYLFEIMPSYNSGSVENAVDGLQRMEQVLSLLPTQSVRTEEQVEYQQFSTPPNIAYLAAWTANVQSGETVLEPSAGIGGLAVFPKAWGANVTVNELSERRLAILKGMGFSAEYNENAEYIDDILPDEVKPTLVIMNPPFSSTAGRLKAHKTSNAEKHINSALARLSDGGRLVAILGKGMNDSDYSRYWNDLRQSYTIRANISIDGYNYRKYGTNYDVQLVVIDKIGSQGNAETFTGSYKDLAELPAILEVIRNERRTAEQPADQSGIQVPSVPAESGRMENADSAVDLVRNRNAGIVPGRDGAYSGAVGESGVSSEYEADASPVSAADAGNAGDSRPRSDLQPGEAESAGEKSPESKKPGKSSTGGHGTPRNAGNERGTERAGSGAESARSGSVNSAENATGVSEERSDDGVYADYAVPTLPVTGAKKHPARLVESAAMSAVSMPPATYTPALPKEVVENNLSDAQMVSVVYAGQAHSQVLPSGERKGFFIGDGTGVGKGRQISGIILDNIMQGRKKAVWISKNASLFPDAQRDWVDTTGRSKDEVHDFSKIKLQDSISFGDGILFSTYDTLRVEKGEHSRLKQIADWLGKDFDGVIAFDEAHNMGNLLGKQGSRGKTKGSEKARAAVELQKMLPNARVVYVSATAATEVEGLAFASRLGLWGTGTPFYDVKEFVNQIGSAGLSAMELVVRDMKALGVYDARSISYNGVAYDTVLHNLDETQRYIYDEMSRAWQNVMRNVEQYLKSTGAYNNSQARSTAIGQFYSSMQRFYNQVLTSMSMPSVIADMKKELAAGRSCVLQIVNTNQAEADRQIASIKAENGSLDDMDLTPRSALIGYLESCFPVYKFEEYLDDNGNIRSRQVLDSQGQPVIDKAAVRKRDALIAEINEMSIPDGPLEMLFNAFGTDKVAEVTGRSRRVVPKLMDDGSVTRVEESRTKNSTEADVTAFQEGKKRILVFSDAGGTGKSYHASLTAKNQQQRVHYVLQPGWIASNAVQGFGRTHRSNEASAPIYKLVTTDIKGQKRFTSTIARRLDQLGALTKGQRNTGSGMFGANDNLETDLAKDSLREFYRRLGTGSIEGVDGKSVLQKLGLLSTFTDEFGRLKLDENVARDVSKFLNRILALEVDEQNEVFDAFTGIYETELENAIAAGTLDTGMENVKADKVDIVDDKVINTQKGTGAETHYIQAKVYTRPKIIRTVAEASEIRQAGFVGFYKTKSGDVRSVYRMPDKTDIYGRINKQYRLYSPTGKYSTWKESTLESSAEQIDKKDWQREWDAEIKKAPEFNEETVHMLTGALLPVWNKLPSDGITKVKRILADDGTAYLGRIIGADKIDGVLSLFSASRTHEAYTGEIISQRVLDGKRIFLTNGRAEFFRSRVSGEWRIEYTQSNSFMIPRIYPEMIMERINYQNRYFVPVSEKGKALIDKIIANNPVSREANASDDDEQYSLRNPESEEYGDYEEEAEPDEQYLKRVTDKETLAALAKAESEGVKDWRNVKPGDLEGVVKVYRAMQAQPVDENGNVVPRSSVIRIVSTDPLMVEARVFGAKKSDPTTTAIYPAKLFSPMAGQDNGVWRNPINLNEWEMSEGHPEKAYHVIDKKTGKPKIDTTKGNASYGEVAYYFGLEKGGVDNNGKPKGDVPARYNPYIHTSLSALNDQFSSGNKRPELVTVESLVPLFHINTPYEERFRQPYAKDKVGAMRWHSGPTSSRLAKLDKARVVILSGYDKPIRVVPDSEVAKSIANTIGDSENIAIQESTVTPSLAAELRKLGVSVLNETEWRKYSEDYPVDYFSKAKKGGKKAKTVVPDEADEQYSRRSSPMTDRDILEMAADMVDESNYTDGEKDALRIFKERLTTLQELTEQREDMGKTYRAQQFGKPADRKGAEQTLARMKIIDGRIEKARNAVLDVESKPVLRDVLSKSRNILEQQGKAATKAALNKLRAKTAESAGVKKYRKRIADDVADITKWITNPSNKSSLDRVPDAIKNPVIDFLNALDFTSKRALKGGAATKADAVVMARAKRLSEAMKKGFDVNEAYARYELPDDFFDRMDDFIRAADAYASAGEFTINEMTAQELKVLSGLVKNLKKFIRQVNRFHQNAIFEHVSEASQSSMDFMRELGEAKRDGNLDNFLLWQNIRPAYGFERFGRGGEAIWDELRRGQDKLAFNTVEISDFVKQTYTPEQVKEWSETVEVFEIGDEKEPVSIPVAYLMGLYELSKDPDGARHILEGGIRVAPFTVGKNRVTNNGVDMTQLSLSEMVDRLKKKYPEAAETADKMQRFMSRTGGKMANEVSMARFGEEMFTNEKYYPISSDGRLFDVSADKPYDNQNLYALLNMSFTKNRIEGANNRVVIYNIFDVFSNHMSGVATYNALALPVLDTLKWLNYRETVINETGDVVKGERLTEVMDRTFGGGNDEAPGSNARGYATKFVLDIVRSYNGTTPQSSPIDRFAINALHHYNVAQVAFNGRVVIQQPLAIVRAGMYLNIGDITGAIASFRKGKAYYTEKHNEMLRNSGIAAWKDLGFYDVNISRGLTELIKQDDSKVDKLNDFGLKAAEAADSVTWTAIWVASEKAAERKGFAPDSERYMEEVVRIFEEVIYKTQVVDSVLTKTAWLRDKGAVARATGSFMNEPVTTYNLLEDAYDKFNMDKRRGMSNQQAWQKNGKRIARIAMIYGLTALTNAMITAIADAWRDDDDYQTALEKWWEAFRGNIVDELIPFNKLPLVSEAYDLILMTLNKMGLDVAGYEPNSFLFQWSDDWLKSVEIISDKMKGEDTNYTWYAGIYYLLRAVSGMTAVPLGSITREVSDIWNNSVGALAPSLKLITYDPGVKNSIKYALWDGYLTEAEAADALVKAGIMNAADAREQARHWAYANSNPDSTLTLTQLSNYDKYASPAGITIEEYENFLLSVKDYKGDTKKERIVAKINAMPVSARQKDAYFYAAGYKSSTLEQTPWHFDMSGWQIDDYKEYGAPAGIPKETFKTFTEAASKIKGDDKNGDGKTDSGSKKAKVIAYIDGLSLTPDQKDALYYQQGYAESKIGDTPWH